MKNMRDKKNVKKSHRRKNCTVFLYMCKDVFFGFSLVKFFTSFNHLKGKNYSTRSETSLKVLESFINALEFDSLIASDDKI